jgi:hypothetical protein
MIATKLTLLVFPAGSSLNLQIGSANIILTGPNGVNIMGFVLIPNVAKIKSKEH